MVDRREVDRGRTKNLLATVDHGSSSASPEDMSRAVLVYTDRDTTDTDRSVIIVPWSEDEVMSRDREKLGEDICDPVTEPTLKKKKK